MSLVTDHEELLHLGWSSFVDSHPEDTVFQSPDMYELFENSMKMKPVVVGLADKGTSSLKGLLVGVTIREMKGLAGYFAG